MYMLIIIAGACQIANWTFALVDKLEKGGNDREDEVYL